MNQIINKSQCRIFYFCIFVYTNCNINGSGNRCYLAIIIPVDQETFMIWILSVEDSLCFFIRAQIGTHSPGTIQKKRNGTFFTEKVGSIIVNGHSKRTILEYSIGKQGLPDFKGFYKIFICKCGFSLNCWIKLFCTDIIGNIHPHININPCIFCTNCKREFSIVT